MGWVVGEVYPLIRIAGRVVELKVTVILPNDQLPIVVQDGRPEESLPVLGEKGRAPSHGEIAIEQRMQCATVHIGRWRKATDAQPCRSKVNNARDPILDAAGPHLRAL